MWKDLLVIKVLSILNDPQADCQNRTFALSLVMDGFLIINLYSF